MRRLISPLWWRWLLVVSIAGVLFGTLMVLAPAGLLGPMNETIYDGFFAGDRYAALSVEALAFQRWVYGVLGATMAGWCLTAAFIAYYPFRAGERWSWWALGVAIVFWYLLDTGTSWWHGVTFNVILNTVLLVAFGVPLLATWRFFTGRVQPIPDSYWVRHGQLLAGEYPGSADEREARRRVGWLLASGVTLFLDLTREGEREPYAALLQEEDVARGHRALYQRVPIQNGTVPAPEEMVRILDTIDEALAAGHVVYLHCVAGVGRTGVVAGCWLVRHGLEGEEALRELDRRRQGIPRGRRPSPFRRRQWQMVLEWPVGK